MTPADPVWQEVWSHLRRRLERTAASVRACNSRFRWNLGRNGTDRMPFRAWAAFSRDGRTGEEDLVISVDVRRDGERLVVMCDIARDGLDVLAQAERSEVDWGQGEEAARGAVLAAEARIEEFLERHLPVIQAELCGR
jgi:hypothetical protein